MTTATLRPLHEYEKTTRMRRCKHIIDCTGCVIEYEGVEYTCFECEKCGCGGNMLSDRYDRLKALDVI